MVKREGSISASCVAVIITGWLTHCILKSTYFVIMNPIVQINCLCRQWVCSKRCSCARICSNYNREWKDLITRTRTVRIHFIWIRARQCSCCFPIKISAEICITSDTCITPYIYRAIQPTVNYSGPINCVCATIIIKLVATLHITCSYSARERPSCEMQIHGHQENQSFLRYAFSWPNTLLDFQNIEQKQKQ